MSLTIYHNPRCSKSRETLARIEAAGQTPTIIKYLEDVPSVEDLKVLLQKLGFDTPRQMMRVKEAEYKNQGLADVDDAALFQAMAQTPKLIERPIVVSGEKAVLGRPPENVDALL